MGFICLVLIYYFVHYILTANIASKDGVIGSSNYNESKVQENASQKYPIQEKNEAANNRFKSSQMKVIQTLFVVCGLFFICYVPSVIMLLLSAVLTSEQLDLGVSFANIFAFTNCAANPVIYIGMHTTMRKRFVETIQFWKKT